MHRPRPSPSRLVAALALALGGAADPATAEAQALRAPARAPVEAEIAEARLLFQAGNAAADGSRFSDALSLFSRAFELSGNPAALYNAAKTLRALGRHVDARDAFDQLLARDDVSEQTRVEATTYRDEEARRVATLTVLDLPAPDAALALRIDGVGRADPGVRPLVLSFDPGRHGLSVERGGFEPFAWDGALTEGQRESLRVVLTPLPDDRSIAEEPLLWVVVGLALAAGGAVAGYVLWDEAQLTPASARVIPL